MYFCSIPEERILAYCNVKLVKDDIVPKYKLEQKDNLYHLSVH